MESRANTKEKRDLHVSAICKQQSNVNIYVNVITVSVLLTRTPPKTEVS